MAFTQPIIGSGCDIEPNALDFWTARGMRLVSGSLETNGDPLLGVKVADDVIRIYDTAKRLVAQLSSTIGSSDLFVDHIWIKNVLFSLNESINEFSLYNAAYDASIKLGMGSTALDRSNLIIALNEASNNIILSIKNALTQIRLESGGVRLIGDMIRLELEHYLYVRFARVGMEFCYAHHAGQ